MLPSKPQAITGLDSLTVKGKECGAGLTVSLYLPSRSIQGLTYTRVVLSPHIYL